jgi:Fe-S cluster assembly iron-binding protein IscA
MLTVTPAASSAVAAILDSPQVPDGAGLRLQEGIDAQGQASIGIAVVTEPDERDRHIPVDEAHELLVADELVEILEDQLLDAEIQDERVAFRIEPRATDGGPPVGSL